MKYWNDAITLYNRYEDKQTNAIQWCRHILINCFVKRTNNKINIGGEQLVTDDIIIRIPNQYNYKKPCEWVNISDDIRFNYITLQPGDLILLGKVFEDIDEYTAGQRSNDLISKYKLLGSIFVTAVNINDFMPGAHYLVRG